MRGLFASTSDRTEDRGPTWDAAEREDGLADLAERARHGDREAFAALYEALYPRVWAFVSRRLRRREDAEDVVSRTFHRFLSGLASFDPRRGSVPAFVISIARNAMIDDARARRPQIALEDAALFEGGTALSRLLEHEELRVLAAEIERLDRSAQELLVMRFGDGLACKEIAAVLGVREKAIHKRLSRLLNELRQSVDGAMGKGGGT